MKVVEDAVRMLTEIGKIPTVVGEECAPLVVVKFNEDVVKGENAVKFVEKCAPNIKAEREDWYNIVYQSDEELHHFGEELHRCGEGRWVQ